MAHLPTVPNSPAPLSWIPIPSGLSLMGKRDPRTNVMRGRRFPCLAFLSIHSLPRGSDGTRQYIFAPRRQASTGVSHFSQRWSSRQRLWSRFVATEASDFHSTLLARPAKQISSVLRERPGSPPESTLSRPSSSAQSCESLLRSSSDFYAREYLTIFGLQLASALRRITGKSSIALFWFLLSCSCS